MLGAMVSGDFDGDRKDDFAFASGKDDGSVRIRLARSPNRIQTLEPLAGKLFGYSLAAGDFDGDLKTDLVVAQLDAPDPTIHVFPGSHDGVGSTATTLTDLTGEDVSAGMTVAMAGDMNGDGLMDLAVGIPATSTVHIYLGSATGLVREQTLTRSGMFGSSLAGGNDLNDDGYADLVIGAPRASGSRGQVLVFYGGPDLDGGDDLFEGTAAGDRLGSQVATLGDHNRDGYPGFAASLAGAQAVRVYRGTETGVVVDTQLEAPAGLGGFGASLVSLDHNLDGHADLAVGGPTRAPGAVVLYVGTPNGFPPLPSWIYAPIEGGKSFGSLLASAGSPLEPDQLAVGDIDRQRVLFYGGTDDIDGDFLKDAMEWHADLNALSVDTDGDGLSDLREWGLGRQPLDTDGDKSPDANDTDSDDDGIHDAVDNCVLLANADQLDTDADGQGDACEDGLECDELHPDLSHVVVTDIGTSTGLDDKHFGHSKRGRALIAADFNLDGITDFFQGNPGDESFVLIGVDDGMGGVRYELNEMLLADSLAWGGGTADYDNDGDYDIFVSNGGNECAAFDNLFRNEFMETGTLTWTDVTDEAGVGGIKFGPGPSPAMPQASANSEWVDFDRDGDVDLFVNANSRVECDHSLPPFVARNTLWLNNGDGTFSDYTIPAGILSALPSRNSTWFDYDNDGDIDLYETAFGTPNILWRNELVETGMPKFTDATTDLSSASDVSEPVYSFATCADDFDNDGWLDLMAFQRGGRDCADVPNWAPVAQAHRLFLNDGGTSFNDTADAWGLNDHPIDLDFGVMGCQIADVDADGRLDVFFGNGGPIAGGRNQLFLWNDSEQYMMHASPLIDFPAPSALGPSDPPYPYRTHGSAFVDHDNDGTLELAVNNGGPDFMPDQVREPNRLFSFDWGAPVQWLKVQPVGDGVNVSKDGIGTRAALTVTGPSGQRTIHRYLPGSSCFSAFQGFELYFGLGDATSVDRLEITWTDGTTSEITSGLSLNDRIVVNY